MKLLWKIINQPENPWVTLVRKRDRQSSSLLDHNLPHSGSWQWKKLMSVRDIFRKGLRWIIGNGHDVLFWKDNWCTQKPLLDYAKDGVQIDDLRVKDVILPDRIWNVRKLKDLIPDHVIQLIISIRIPDNKPHDKMIWGLTPDGIFLLNLRDG